MNTGAAGSFTVLALGNLLDTAFIHQILNTDSIEKLVNLLTEFNPQLVRKTLFSIIATPLTGTSRCHDFING